MPIRMVMYPHEDSNLQLQLTLVCFEAQSLHLGFLVCESPLCPRPLVGVQVAGDAAALLPLLRRPPSAWWPSSLVYRQRRMNAQNPKIVELRFLKVAPFQYCPLAECP